jgi:hypothetical protein
MISSSKKSLPFRIFDQWIAYLFHACYMPRLSHPPWFYLVQSAHY